MNSICRDIFKAIHEGRWLSIEYRNQQGQQTNYWIGIRDLNASAGTLAVDGLHLGQCSLARYEKIYIASIQSAKVIEGSFCPVNEALVQDIHLNPHKYRSLFGHTANLQILDYLEDCHRMDASPYRADFALIEHLDRDSFQNGVYPLNDRQFQVIVQDFEKKGGASSRREQNSSGAPASSKAAISLQRLAMNVLSIHTKRGLYVLAYRRLDLDVKSRCLRPDDDITVCTEFTVSGETESIRRYLDAEDYELLRDFAANQEKIKDAIARSARRGAVVDDMPYIIGLGFDIALDLRKEYGGILSMYREGNVSVPIRAFFGELLDRPRSRQTLPMALADRKVNLDQLLAIRHAMKYPVAYVQGPPGTGKTSTIINTVITAFFNGKTVLFAAYNNHPIDGVIKKLSSMTYRGKTIPFPVLRLGNSKKVEETLSKMKTLYEKTADISIYSRTLDRDRDARTERAKELSALLKRYEDILDLTERRETIQRMLDYDSKQAASMNMVSFEADLSGRQTERIRRRLEKLGTISDEDALALLDTAEEEQALKKYLYYTSVRHIQMLGDPKYEPLLNILFIEDKKEQVREFTKYLSSEDGMKAVTDIFPVVATTCISAHRLGEPKPFFDMTVMDEAGQCNIAVGLVPVIRGHSLLLVGDPQQLNPVILLDETTNQKLMQKYKISKEYDYRENSIYKAYLACDSVSDEVLLRCHYRCHKKIIGFNNQKYYNSRLLIRSEQNEPQPLIYVDVEDSQTVEKNTAPAEANEIVRYAELHRDKTIGVITPFVNQRKLIEQMLLQRGLEHVACGTVHAFQGDEKDVVLFSTAITDATGAGTYQWLKNNRELINVATSRAKEKLIVLSSSKNLERLHEQAESDDLYDLVRYVRTDGTAAVASKEVTSRALGVKPFSTATEEAFLQSLNHALGNIWLSQNHFSVEREVAVSQVFDNNTTYDALFYSGRFDFVVYEQTGAGKYPVLVIELDGKEHSENDVVMARDRRKNDICRAHNMELIRVENTYARRYQHIKGILEAYFKVMH